MVYRTNFVFSMFEVIALVKRGAVFVNNVLISYVNYIVKVGDIISFDKIFFPRFKYNFLKRFVTKTILFNTPRYMYVSYKLFFCFYGKTAYSCWFSLSYKIRYLSCDSLLLIQV